MKKTVPGWLTILVFSGVFFSALLCSGAPEIEFTRVRVSIAKVNTAPLPNIGSMSPLYGQKFNNSWLLIYVDYMPSLTGTATTTRYEWADDVTMAMTVVCSGEVNGKSVPCAFEGETRFWSIPLDGKKHSALMVIPPQILDRYLPSKGPGKKVTTSNVAVRVRFLGKSGKYLGGGCFYISNAASDMKEAAFDEMLKSQNLLRVPGAVFSRINTPWAWGKYDQLDLIKPDSVK